MKLLSRFYALLAPDVCLGCGQEGGVVCDECAQGFDYFARCYWCKNPAGAHQTCAKCQKRRSVDALFALGAYEGLAKQVVQSAKYTPSRSSAVRMGELLSHTLPYIDPSDTVVMYVPTSPARIRERGFDQAKVMAKALARQKRFLFSSGIIRRTNAQQIGSTRKERIEHARSMFTLQTPHIVKGKTIIVVDDVLTTGASIDAVGAQLKRARARRVLAVVFARA